MINKILKAIYNKKEKYVVGTEVVKETDVVTAESVKKIVQEQILQNTKDAIKSILNRITLNAKNGNTIVEFRITYVNDITKTCVIDSDHRSSVYVYYNIIINELETRGFKVIIDQPFFTVKW